MLGNIGEKVTVAVLTAAILGALAAIWQVASDGGIVRALGGVTRAELDAVSAIPDAAVVAFDSANGCPEGWTPFADGQGRVILGASSGSSDGLFRDVPLTRYKYRDHDGAERVALTVKQMPRHGHVTGVVRVVPKMTAAAGHSHEMWLDVQEPDGGLLNLPYFLDGASAVAEGRSDGVVQAAGDAETHDNMPPYIALYFCKKG